MRYVRTMHGQSYDHTATKYLSTIYNIKIETLIIFYVAGGFMHRYKAKKWNNENR